MPSPQIYCSAEIAAAGAAKIKAKWNVVQTLIKREADIFHRLLRRGRPAYLPTVRREIVHHRQKRVYDDPLFPGYVFLAGDVSWGEVREQCGEEFGRLCRITGEEQTELDDRLGAFYRMLEAGRSFKLVRRPLKGREVEVTGGPLKGVKGRCIRALGRTRQRLLIWVQFLGAGAELDISAADLEFTD